MQKIITGQDVKKLDSNYIQSAGIRSFDLMERAADAFVQWFVSRYGPGNTIGIFCGVGNNGGDGLAIGRMLSTKGYNPTVFFTGDISKASADFEENFKILPYKVPIIDISKVSWDNFSFDIIIDAVFGVGISRPLSADYLKLIQKLNQLQAKKIAVDLPSGLPSDDILDGEAFKADHTVTFQFPKLSLLLPEHAAYTGELVVADIGIDASFFDGFSSPFYYIRKKDILPKHRYFNRFSHKGNFGRILLIGGSLGKIGAMVLASHAALRTGSGLVSCYLPNFGVDILQNSLPEVMVQSGKGEAFLTDDNLLNQDLNQYNAIGMGPGMGMDDEAVNSLETVLKNFKNHLVLDADALNIMAGNRDLFSFLREGIVLTPHIKEFERLVGKCENQLDRIAKARNFSMEYHCVLVLKGANTLVSLPDGRQLFNSSGTQYMGTAGAGDVLTGMIASFLGQGYSPENAAICGVFHHGLAGEIASESKLRGTIASDIIRKIPQTFVRMEVH